LLVAEILKIFDILVQVVMKLANFTILKCLLATKKWQILL